MTYKKYLFLILAFFSPLTYSFSQPAFGSEEALKKQADQHYKTENYAAAEPLYSELLSLYPKDALYNMRYGVCILYAGKEKSKAIPYLEAATKNAKPDPLAFYFLGRAYHLNFQLDEAINAFNDFKNKGKSSDVRKYDVDRQISTCVNAKELAKSLAPVTLLDRQEMPFADFYRAYNVPDAEGKILSTPDNYKSVYDKKNKINSLLYLSRLNHMMFFASYPGDGSSGKDLYKVSKLISSDTTEAGEWGVPMPLGATINSLYDEDYPFLSSDGKTLYYSSTGHNSMGGYDIFKSTWNGTYWTEPENLGPPVNSPADEFFFISDEGGENIFFASNRNTDFTKVEIIHSQAATANSSLVLIKGNFSSKDNPQLKEAKITVLNAEDNSVIGTYNSDPRTGGYEITLPLGTTYKYVVEAEGYLPHAENVTLPSRVKQSVLHQDIKMKKSETAEDMVVSNSFFPEAEPGMPTPTSETQQVVQEVTNTFNPAEKEKLQPVTINGETVYVTPTTPAEQAPKSTLPLGAQQTYAPDLSNTDIVKIAYEDARQIKEDAAETQKEASAAQAIANERDSLAKVKTEEAHAGMEKAQAIQDEAVKAEEVSKAKKAEEEALEMQKQADLAKEIAQQLDAAATEKQKEADEIYASAQELEKAVASGAPVPSVRKPTVKQEKTPDKAHELAYKNAEELKKESSETKQDADSTLIKAQQYQKESELLAQEAQEIKTDAEKISDPAEKAAIEQKAEELETASAQRKKDAEITFETANLLEDSARNQQKEAELSISLAKDLESKQTLAADIPATTTSPDSTAVAQAPATSPSETATPEVPVTNPPVEVQPTTPATNEVVAQAPPASISDSAVTPTAETRETGTAPATGNESSPQTTATTVSPSAEDVVKEAVQLDELSKQMFAIADTVTNPEEKAKTLEQANDLKRQADVKRLEAEKMIAASAQSPGNAPETATVSAETTAMPTPVVSDSIGRLMTQEADQLLASSQQIQMESEALAQQAMQAKRSSEATTDPSEKQRLNEEANTLNTSSLNKQQQAQKDFTYANQLKVYSTTADGQLLWLKNKEAMAAQTTVTPASEIQSPATSAQTTTSETATYTTQTTSPETLPDTTSTTPVALEIPAGIETATPADAVPPPTTTLTTASEVPSPSTSPEGENMAQKRLQESDQVSAEATQMQMQSEDLARQAMSLRRQASVATNPAEKKRLLDQSNALNLKSINQQKEAQNKLTYAQQLRDNATNPDFVTSSSPGTPSTTEAPTRSTSAETITTPPPATENTTSPISPPGVSAPPAAIPPGATAVFTKTEGPAYSAANPIPMDAKLPEGLIFKVQVGAFRNPIPQDHFKGIQPLAGERTPGGLTKYTAGFFKTFESANLARKEIRGIGYRDAFVVAYYNGKRINLGEAARTIQQNNAQQNQEYQLALTEETKILKANNIYPEKYSADAGDRPLASFANPETQTTSAPAAPVLQNAPTLATPQAASTEATTLPAEGLFYTVQVGVYRKPEIPDNLKAVAPLSKEQLPNGLYRYTSGIYQRFGSADSAKLLLSTGAVPDAFVIAYYNGKKISVDEARNMQGNAQPAPIATSTPSDNTTTPSEEPVAPESISFKIQVGAFKEKVPVNYVDLYFRIADRGISTAREPNGMTVFYAGNVKDLASAESLKNEVIASGVPDAFIVAFSGDKKISLAQAEAALNK